MIIMDFFNQLEELILFFWVMIQQDYPFIAVIIWFAIIITIWNILFNPIAKEGQNILDVSDDYWDAHAEKQKRERFLLLLIRDIRLFLAIIASIAFLWVLFEIGGYISIR